MLIPPLHTKHYHIKLLIFSVLFTPLFAIAFFNPLNPNFLWALLPGAYLSFTISFWDTVLIKTRSYSTVSKLALAALLTILCFSCFKAETWYKEGFMEPYLQTAPSQQTSHQSFHNLLLSAGVILSYLWSCVYFFRAQISRFFRIKDPILSILDSRQ